MNRIVFSAFGLSMSLLASLSAAAASTPAEPYESLASYKASDVLPPEIPESDDYTIDEEVLHNGYLYQYVIRSRFGNFEVQGNSLLLARVNEMKALVELEKNSEVGIVVEAAIDSLIETGKSPFALAESILTRPAETISGLPAGVGRWVSRTSRQLEGAIGGAKDTASKGATKEGMESYTRQAMAYGDQWLGVDKAERSWAARLNVDPYSSNEVLRKAIKEAASYEATSRTLVDVAVPTVDALEIISTANNLVWELDPYELRQRDTDRLEEAGADRELIETFYENPWYSPSLQSVIVSSVLSLRDVSGRKNIFEKLPAAASEVEARFVAESIALGAYGHSKVSKVMEISGEGTMPMGVTDSGSYVVYLSLDHVVWTEEVAEGFAPFMNVTGEAGGDMYFTGTLSDRARDALNEGGWRTHERFSIDTARAP